MKGLVSSELIAKREKRARKEAAHREARRAKFMTIMEVARATRPSKLLPVGVGYVNGVSHYSLASNGFVRQGMTFRWDTERADTKGGYASSTWNLSLSGTRLTVKEFVANYAARGFEVKVYDKPKKVNYDKPVRQLRGAGDPEDPELTLRVLELFMTGVKPKAIAEELGLEERHVRHTLCDL